MGGLCPGDSLSMGLSPGGSLSKGSLSRGSVSGGGLCQGDPHCCMVMCGRYASYWNAFLLNYVIDAKCSHKGMEYRFPAKIRLDFTTQIYQLKVEVKQCKFAL